MYLAHTSKVHDSVDYFPFWFSETVPLCCLELAVLLSQLQQWDSKSGPGPALLILSSKQGEAWLCMALSVASTILPALASVTRTEWRSLTSPISLWSWPLPCRALLGGMVLVPASSLCWLSFRQLGLGWYAWSKQCLCCLQPDPEGCGWLAWATLLSVDIIMARSLVSREPVWTLGTDLG